MKLVDKGLIIGRRFGLSGGYAFYAGILGLHGICRIWDRRLQGLYLNGLPFELFAKRILYISLSCESGVNRCKRSCPLDHASLCIDG